LIVEKRTHHRLPHWFLCKIHGSSATIRVIHYYDRFLTLLRLVTKIKSWSELLKAPITELWSGSSFRSRHKVNITRCEFLWLSTRWRKRATPSEANDRKQEIEFVQQMEHASSRKDRIRLVTTGEWVTDTRGAKLVEFHP
jgi:hypothetical protein